MHSTAEGLTDPSKSALHRRAAAVTARARGHAATARHLRVDEAVVAMTTSSRMGASALPTSSSLAPAPEPSAVSKKVQAYS